MLASPGRSRVTIQQAVYTVTLQDATSSRGACLVLVVNASEFVSVGVAYVCDVEGRFVIWARTGGAFIPPTMLERGDVESMNLGFILGAEREHRTVPCCRYSPI